MLMRIKGIHTTRKRLADGSLRVYHYAWRGGPRITGQPGTVQFQAAYAKIMAARAEHRVSVLGDVIDEYLVSAEFKRLSADHHKAVRRYLELIRAKFGKMPLQVVDDKRIKGDFRRFRDTFQGTPRKADYVWSTLSRLMTFSIERGHTSTNPCTGAGRLYEADRTEAIWNADAIRAFVGVASPPLARALTLALWTGQRQGDLLRLTWAAYDGKTLRLKQSKGRARVPVPLGGICRDMLEAMKAERKQAVTILTNSKGKPWTSDGFRTSWDKAVRKAGITDLHFHDLRGTAVTRLALSGATVPEIASITGHSLKTVQEILDRHYLGGRLELAEAGIAKLDAVYGSGTKAVN
jgi:integrase